MLWSQRPAAYSVEKEKKSDEPGKPSAIHLNRTTFHFQDPQNHELCKIQQFKDNFKLNLQNENYEIRQKMQAFCTKHAAGIHYLNDVTSLYCQHNGCKDSTLSHSITLFPSTPFHTLSWSLTLQFHLVTAPRCWMLK